MNRHLVVRSLCAKWTFFGILGLRYPFLHTERQMKSIKVPLSYLRHAMKITVWLKRSMPARLLLVAVGDSLPVPAAGSEQPKKAVASIGAKYGRMALICFGHPGQAA